MYSLSKSLNSLTEKYDLLIKNYNAIFGVAKIDE